MRVRFGVRLMTLLCLLMASVACRADINRVILDCQARSAENSGIGQSSHLNADYCAGIKAFMAKDFGKRCLCWSGLLRRTTRERWGFWVTCTRGRAV